MTPSFEKNIQIAKIILGILVFISLWYMYAGIKSDIREQRLIEQIKKLDL